MKLIIVKNYEEMSYKASLIMKEILQEKPDAVLGLATGSSPIGIYQNLINFYNNKEISFEKVKTYNLDEYCDLPRSHSESYYSFMHRNLFSKININKSNIHLPNSESDNLQKSCDEYNELLKNANIDIQLLGIGGNGHIGFNEPNTSFDQETWVVKLTDKTREDNKRFFNSIDEVPKYAITMGIKNIMCAKKILLVASGKGKAEAIKKLIDKKISIEFPASVLHLHDNVVVIVDEDAASLIK